MEKMLTNFLKFFEKLFNLFLHAFFVSMVVYFAWPILSLYWNLVLESETGGWN